MANCEEQPPPLPFQETPEINRFQLLQLDSTPPGHHRCPAAASTKTRRRRPLDRCTSCGSLKKRSTTSSSSSLLQEQPTPKRPALCHPLTPPPINATAVADENQNVASPIPMQSFLNRSQSDITSYMAAIEVQSEETSKINSFSDSPSPAAASSLPPLPPVLQRCLSEPIPSDSNTPLKPPQAPRNSFPSPGSDQESSNSKRLRRIKERMKQMRQWVEKVASEEDDDDQETCSANDQTSDQNLKEILETGHETTRPNQEAVSVEENGDNLIVRFNCPCDRAYELIVSGKKCYYRLM